MSLWFMAVVLNLSSAKHLRGAASSSLAELVIFRIRNNYLRFYLFIIRLWICICIYEMLDGTKMRTAHIICKSI